MNVLFARRRRVVPMPGRGARIVGSARLSFQRAYAAFMRVPIASNTSCLGRARRPSSALSIGGDHGAGLRVEGRCFGRTLAKRSGSSRPAQGRRQCRARAALIGVHSLSARAVLTVQPRRFLAQAAAPAPGCSPTRAPQKSTASETSWSSAGAKSAPRAPAAKNARSRQTLATNRTRVHARSRANRAARS